MLTSEKIKVFKNYKGYYDGYYMQSKNKDKVITGNEWALLDNLIQDIFLFRKGLASESFEAALMKRLKESCDSDETINLCFELERYLNGG